MEIEVGGLEKAVFEIVQIEQHTLCIKHRLRIAVTPIKSSGTPHLDIGQFAHDLLQQFFFPLIVSPSCFSAALDGLEEREVTQILLQVSQFIIINSQHIWHGQLTLFEVFGKIDKRMVLITARTYHSYYRTAISITHAVIGTVTPRSHQFLGEQWFLSFPPFI